MKYTTRYITRITGSLMVAGLMVAGLAGAADTATSSPLSSKGSEFVKEASGINQTEIALAQLAQQKAQNSDVKDLAKMIEQDHQQSQEKLQGIAQAHGVTLDPNLGWSQRRMQSKLEKLNGSDFDQQYTKDMLEGHAAAIKKFQKASQQVEDADVKQYAVDTLPHLQGHLQHSETAAKSAGVDEATITSITKNVPAVGGTGENQESGSGVGAQKP
jgi:putative membrane protein